VGRGCQKYRDTIPPVMRVIRFRRPGRFFMDSDFARTSACNGNTTHAVGSVTATPAGWIIGNQYPFVPVEPIKVDESRFVLPPSAAAARGMARKVATGKK